MSKQPFTFEAYKAAFKQDPDFDLFKRFSFDHLNDAEIEQISHWMKRQADNCYAEAEALRAERFGNA